MNIIQDLIENSVTTDEAAQKALESPDGLMELLEGVLSHQDETRYNSFKVLLLVSETHPEVLYPFWTSFEEMLNSQNSNFQSIAIHILANLVSIDTDKKFEKIVEVYFKILEGDKTITCAFIAGNAWKIARSKPGLQAKVTEKLLNIDHIHQGKQKDLIKGHAIESFGHYYGEADIESKKRILAFVKLETASRSPRTKKAAKEFLKEWE
jgi:hypothetical protein